MAAWRWLGILALALLAFAVAGVMGSGHGGAVDVKKSTCWSCHSSWSPPLKWSANLIPSEGVSAEVGQRLAYSVQVENAWRHEIRGYTLTVDLTGAPALNFASGADPIRDRTLRLTIPSAADSAAPGDPLPAERAADAQVNLTVPASSSSLRITPSDPSPVTGPTLVGFVVAPDGSVAEHPAAGPGRPIEVPDPFTGRSGSFRIGAKVLPPAPGSPSPPTLGAVPFEVRYSASFELDGLRHVPLTVQAFLEPGKVLLQGGLNFTVVRPAGEGERLLFWLNTTNHYEHTNTNTQGGDWANWTQDPVEVRVVMQGTRVALQPTEREIFRPQPVNGVTLTTAGEAVGYASTFLIVSSIASGGMFGKASRRAMNRLFGSAKRRVAFHNFLSYGITVLALAHTVMFLLNGDYKWTRGILWGGGAMLAMLGLGVTGALQVPMIRRWNYGTWRWTHYGLTVATIVLTLLHMLLEGAHFGEVQGAIGYSDPFNPVPTA